MFAATLVALLLAVPASATNNWWIASKDCMHVGASSQIACSCDGLLGETIDFNGDGSNTFRVQLASSVASNETTRSNVRMPISNVSASEHDNYVEFPCDDGVACSFSIVENSHSISDGQPYDGAAMTGDTEIDVKAGRHKTSEVADDFKNGLTVANMACSENMLDQEPSELNFYVNVDFNFNIGGTEVTCSGFRIGQGSY